MEQFSEMYWGLSKTFNPTKFNPDVWASSAKAAGMKYFVMCAGYDKPTTLLCSTCEAMLTCPLFRTVAIRRTTKHHDGFAMYNTSAHGAPGQPVYGVTGPDCPAQRDLFGEVVASMRAAGMFVGAYFSKADWHSHSFWDPSIGFPSDRNTNYDIATNASKWVFAPPAYTPRAILVTD